MVYHTDWLLVYMVPACLDFAKRKVFFSGSLRYTDSRAFDAISQNVTCMRRTCSSMHVSWIELLAGCSIMIESLIMFFKNNYYESASDSQFVKVDPDWDDVITLTASALLCYPFCCIRDFTLIWLFDIPCCRPCN